MSTAVEEIKAPAGTLVHVEGLPFRLVDETALWGLRSNWELAQELEKRGAVVLAGDGGVE